MSKSTIFILLAALGASAAQADYRDDLRNAAKQQANAKMEQTLGIAQPSAPGAKAYIISPKDGETVSGPVKVVFGLSGMGVAPAGTQAENTGHHHLLIDDPTIDVSQPLPVTDQIKHFGKGQTEASIDLKPGKHTLQLLLADWKHQPFNPSLASEKITITVK